MRQFSSIEKEIIQTICEGHKTMANLVCLYLANETIQISHANGNNPLTLFIDNKKYKTDEVPKRAFEITEKIVIIINLLQYLEENALVTYFIPSHGRAFVGNFTRTTELYTYYQNNKSEFTGWWYTDAHTQKYLLDHTDFIIHPTEDLKIHVNNKYQTREEKRHRQTILATWTAIGTSILVGIYGVLQNNMNKTQEIKINEKQKNQIINALTKTYDEKKAPSQNLKDSLNSIKKLNTKH